MKTIMISILFFFMFLYNSNAEIKAKEELIADGIEKPEIHFGFEPGTDRMLFDYKELISYFKKLDKASPRLKLVEIGKSPMGKMMYIALISSERNIKNLDQLKEINRELALDPNIPESERDSMLNKGKVFFLATLSMHSNEVGPTQSAPLIAYDLVTTNDSRKEEWLNDVILMLVPCHNPDGMDMVVNHYKKYKGTKYEGCKMPGLYHKYTGHDNNRDFVTLSQEDTKNIAKIYSQEWFPQVMVEKHQMMYTGVRYFAPPVHDPITDNIDAGIWNWIGIFGSNMIKDMTNQGLNGIAQHYRFDDFSPLYTTFGSWKNTICFFTEAASVKYATPIFVESNELKVFGKGLAEYKKSVNMPSPWSGGWWRLSDIVRYEKASIMSILKTASLHRHDILEFRNNLCKKEVLNGQSKAPFYYISPLKQHDESELINLVNLLKEHGVHVYQLSESSVLDGKSYNKGDVVIPLSQPFRPFIKEVMERQKFPVRHFSPNGKIIKPYGVTSWSLPLHMGVKVNEINSYSERLDSILVEINDVFKLQKKDAPNDYKAALFSVNNNDSFKAAFLALKLGLKVSRLSKSAKIDLSIVPKGSFIVYNNSEKSLDFENFIQGLEVTPVYVGDLSNLEATLIRIPKIALVETNFEDMDTGWTRFIFDTYGLPYTAIGPGDFEKTDFSEQFDVVIFPDVQKSILMTGKQKIRGELIISNYPPEYTKGIGKKGMGKLINFLEDGGVIVSWGKSTGLFLGTLESRQLNGKKEEFQLPIKDISQKLKASGLYCPGSLLKIKLLNDSPITLGMESETGILYKGGPIFTTSIPNFDMERRIIGKFSESNILLSGYCEKEEMLANKTCLVWLKKGKGQLVLFGFNPQFRASTNASFKLLMNSILLSPIQI